MREEAMNLLDRTLSAVTAMLKATKPAKRDRLAYGYNQFVKTSTATRASLRSAPRTVEAQVALRTQGQRSS